MMERMKHNLQIIPIPAFKDNYIWLIHNTKQALVIDPGDATPVLEALQHSNLTLETILITHYHHDHIDGVSELLESYPGVKVYASKLEHYSFEHIPVREGDVIEFENFELKFLVLELPGHTLGHIAYYSNNNENLPLLFCGDTLFGAGCGRLFEGTYIQMFESLQRIALLPGTTKVYCTHEYTMHNLRFALSLEPNNAMLIERFYKTLKLRESNNPSLPSTIALELATNPFLRCSSEQIQTTLQSNNASPQETFRIIREMRNHY
jgi:hydroxyacylglutathione hydrolase